MTKQSPNAMPIFPGQPRRFYMAGTARFLTQVREAEWLGGEHPYAYAMNNPVTYTDPSGLEPCPPIVSSVRDNLTVQLMLLSWEKANINKVSQCIQAAARSKGISCGSFGPSTANCLRDKFPLVDCRCDCPPGLSGYTPGAPGAPADVGHSGVQHITICFNNMAGGTFPNYFPGLGDRTSEMIWITLLHERSMHARTIMEVSCLLAKNLRQLRAAMRLPFAVCIV